VFVQALGALDASLAELVSESIISEHEAFQGACDGARNTLRRRLLEAFGATHKYDDLPRAFGPNPTEGVPALGHVLMRPPKYDAKYLPQEYSLLHKVWVMCGGDCEDVGIIDIGAGNANLAVLASTLLGVTVLCVERDSPRVELRAETYLPACLKARVVRIERDICEFQAADLKEEAAARGLNRVLLLAKHPCGIGVDRSIECAARLLDERTDLTPTVIGAVIATCCTNKLAMDFEGSRVPEFCSLYKGQMRNPTLAFERTVEVMSRSTSWRTNSESLNNAVQTEQIRWSEDFEDALQALRVRRLAEIFGHAVQVRFAPRACTLQDRCLLASTVPLPISDSMDAEFVERVRAGVRALGGPLDCRPKGFKSAKFDFDYTGDMDAESDL